MRPRTLVTAALATLCAATPAGAAVTWHPWQESSFQEAVDRAGLEDRALVLVVTQPDWCPPCIQLNARWLRNPADETVQGLTKEAVVIEVLGYDPPGARLLRDQKVRFTGTPTVHVFAPPRVGRPLGESRLRGSIVGAPDDFPQQLGALLRGDDALASLVAAAAAAGAGRAEALLALGRVHVARGEAFAARRAFKAVEQLTERGLADAALAALADAKREAQWLRAVMLEGRLRKDHAAALRAIDSWTAAHGRPEGKAKDIAYARAWSLAHVGRLPEAIREMQAAYLRSDDLEDLKDYAYFCFRVAEPPLLAEAEGRLHAAIAAHGGDGAPAALWQALGRILRRQGRLEAARAAFERSVAGAETTNQRVVNEGQLAHVNAELSAGGDAHR